MCVCEYEASGAASLRTSHVLRGAKARGMRRTSSATKHEEGLG